MPCLLSPNPAFFEAQLPEDLRLLEQLIAD